MGAIADGLSAPRKQRLPHQRKTQRGKLALLVATMLDVRSANLMDLAAGLPLEADRTDMRYQWITRLLGNPRVPSDEIMEPFAREVLEQAVAGNKPVVLILDQSKLSDRHQVLMLAVRYGERALPLAWRGGGEAPRGGGGGGAGRKKGRLASPRRRRCSRRWRPGSLREQQSGCWA